MPAAEGDHLYVFEVRVLRGKDRGTKHSRVEIVHDIQAAAAQVHVVDAGDCVRSQHRDPHGGKHPGQAVVHQFIVLVGPGCQHHRKLPALRHLIQDTLACFRQFPVEALHCRFRLLDCIFTACGGDPELPGHVLLQLPVHVLFSVPVEQRRVEGNVPFSGGVVGVPYDDGVAFHHGAHGLAGLLTVFRLHSCHRRKEDPVHTQVLQRPQMAVDQFCRETDRVGCHGGKS